MSSGSPALAARRQTWYRDARDCAEQYQKVLEASTIFPRAGEVNHEVNHFVDLCMAVWERGGCSQEETSWLMEVRVGYMLLVAYILSSRNRTTDLHISGYSLRHRSCGGPPDYHSTPKESFGI